MWRACGSVGVLRLTHKTPKQPGGSQAGYAKSYVAGIKIFYESLFTGLEENQNTF